MQGVDVVTGSMDVQMWPIGDVIPYAHNARVLSPNAVSKVAGSLREFGWQQPIVVDSEGVVVVGHTRLLAAQYLGMEEVPVVVANDLTDAQVKAYRIADNRVAQESSWDYELLNVELEELEGLGFSVEKTGFDIDELFGDEGAEELDTSSGALSFKVVLECGSEDEQQEVYSRAIEMGWTCKMLTS